VLTGAVLAGVGAVNGLGLVADTMQRRHMGLMRTHDGNLLAKA